MVNVLKVFQTVDRAQVYADKAVAWCTEHCGPLLESEYLYGSELSRSQLNPPFMSVNGQRHLDSFLIAIENFQKVTGLDNSSLVDINFYRGTNWWHFDYQLKSDIHNVTVLPDDVTMVHFKLMVS
jgi:hypothetical protein